MTKLCIQCVLSVLPTIGDEVGVASLDTPPIDQISQLLSQVYKLSQTFLFVIVLRRHDISRFIRFMKLSVTMS